MFGSAVRTTVSRWLENGELSGPCARALSLLHGPLAARGVARPLHVPARSDGAALLTVTVGGATLGGSGKTRVALACARELTRLGAEVVLLGHGYGAAVPRPRVVSAHDALAAVGDEALACVRALASDLARDPGAGVARVVVGPSRQAAIDFTAALEPRVDVVVIDGPLQLAPACASLALLAVDAETPWGAGSVPPSGDLRAPRDALLANADHVVAVDATPRGASRLAAELAPGTRIGVFTALARPHRLVRALARAGLAPTVVVSGADHGPLTEALRRRIQGAGVDLWLATTKCALHLQGIALRSPLRILDETTDLPEAAARALRRLVEGHVRPGART